MLIFTWFIQNVLEHNPLYFCSIKKWWERITKYNLFSGSGRLLKSTNPDSCLLPFLHSVKAKPWPLFLLTCCILVAGYFYTPICYLLYCSFTLQCPCCASRDLFYIPVLTVPLSSSTCLTLRFLRCVQKVMRWYYLAGNLEKALVGYFWIVGWCVSITLRSDARHTYWLYFT